MKDHFMATYNINSQTKLEDFRTDLLNYMNTYNNSSHSSLPNKISPSTRFFNYGENIIEVLLEIMKRDFLIEIERRVSIDFVIKIDRIEYEVPSKYAGRRITLRYTPTIDNYFIVNNDSTLTGVKVLNKVANSTVKRKQPIFNMEEDQ